MKTRKNGMNDELHPEYDLGQLLKGGVRGLHCRADLQVGIFRARSTC